MNHYRNQIPDRAERQRLNRQLHARTGDSGFWGDDGAPAPWPDDIDQWRPEADEPRRPKPGEPPF